MYFIRRMIPIGVILYMFPMAFSWFIFWLISFLIQPIDSIKNSLIAYGIYLILILISFIGGYTVAKRGGVRSWWIKFFFAIVALIQFLPILCVLAPFGALIIYLNSKVAKFAPQRLRQRMENSKLGCTITSILAAMTAFSSLLFIVEKGNVKTAKNISKAVMAINHLGSGDYFIAALLAIFRNWRVMIGANLWKYKIFHWFFSAVGIPIEREEGAHRKRVEAVNTSKNFLSSNSKALLHVFPQGTRERNPANGIQSFKIGAFKIACELKQDIIPVTIIGTNKWRPPSKQDTTSYKGSIVKENIVKILFDYSKQYFQTGINPTIVKVIYGNIITTKDKTPEQVRDETLAIINKTYLSYTQPKLRKKRRMRRA